MCGVTRRAPPTRRTTRMVDFAPRGCWSPWWASACETPPAPARQLCCHPSANFSPSLPRALAPSLPRSLAPSLPRSLYVCTYTLSHTLNSLPCLLTLPPCAASPPCLLTLPPHPAYPPLPPRPSPEGVTWPSPSIQYPPSSRSPPRPSSSSPRKPSRCCSCARSTSSRGARRLPRLDAAGESAGSPPSRLKSPYALCPLVPPVYCLERDAVQGSAQRITGDVVVAAPPPHAAQPRLPASSPNCWLRAPACAAGPCGRPHPHLHQNLPRGRWNHRPPRPLRGHPPRLAPARAAYRRGAARVQAPARWSAEVALQAY